MNYVCLFFHGAEKCKKEKKNQCTCTLLVKSANKIIL